MQHDRSVAQSFGPRADAYLTSTVHAQGADLETLARKIAGTKGAVVLDVGCGGGHVSFATALVAREVVAYDLIEAMLDVVKAEADRRGLTNIHTRQGFAEELPFESASFDWVVSRYSAHHWRNVERALHEVRRVLKPGGQVCFIDVAGGPEPLLDTHLQALELLRDPSHVRNYSSAEWLTFFKAASFEAQVEERWRLPIEFSAWVARIGTSDDRIAAIRSLWSSAPTEVRQYYGLQEDLSFELDVALIVAH